MSTERRPTPAVGNEPRTEAGRALLAEWRNNGGLVLNRLPESGGSMRDRILAIEAEAASQPAAPPIDVDTIDLLALSQHLDHHTPLAAMRTFPRICRCGWEGFDWPVHFYGTIRARLARQEVPHE